MSVYRDEEQARIYREADWAQQLVDTHGWASLARWVTEQAQLERDAIERGVGSWDEYQRSIGRLGAFQEVLARPREVVEVARSQVRGDDE